MTEVVRKRPRISAASRFAATLALIVGLGMSSGARADEAAAKSLFKAMSDYMAAQSAISLSYDTNLEFITKDKQKLALASSGTITLNGPTRSAQRAKAGLPMSRWFLTGRR
jgi:hypothetical protein